MSSCYTCTVRKPSLPHMTQEEDSRGMCTQGEAPVTSSMTSLMTYDVIDDVILTYDVIYDVTDDVIHMYDVIADVIRDVICLLRVMYDIIDDVIVFLANHNPYVYFIDDVTSL